jgi:hypothetical protein
VALAGLERRGFGERPAPMVANQVRRNPEQVVTGVLVALEGRSGAQEPAVRLLQ